MRHDLTITAGMSYMKSAASSECMISITGTWRQPFIMDYSHCKDRGQESRGIAVSDTAGPKGKVNAYKDGVM